MAPRLGSAQDDFNPALNVVQLNRFNSKMRSVVRAHRLRYFVVCHFPEADKAGLLENLVATNWPEDLVSRYEKTDMFRESKVVAGLKKTILPVCSEDLLFARARDGVKSELLGIYYDDGFANTIGLSLHDTIRSHYLIMLSGERKISDRAELALMLLTVMKAIDVLSVASEPLEEALSPRVLDCLRWCAAGKSSEDIALIMEISPHTVNDYIKIAMKRLNAVTRTQAVAIACRLRII
jgi:DNA-binding CsgD family transcriptional regulator